MAREGVDIGGDEDWVLVGYPKPAGIYEGPEKKPTTVYQFKHECKEAKVREKADVAQAEMVQEIEKACQVEKYKEAGRKKLLSNKIPPFNGDVQRPSGKIPLPKVHFPEDDGMYLIGQGRGAFCGTLPSEEDPAKRDEVMWQGQLKIKEMQAGKTAEKRIKEVCRCKDDWKLSRNRY